MESNAFAVFASASSEQYVISAALTSLHQSYTRCHEQHDAVFGTNVRTNDILVQKMVMRKELFHQCKLNKAWQQFLQELS